jgi:HNH endonuclease
MPKWKKPLKERFEEKFTVDAASGCWLLKKPGKGNRYACMWDGEKHIGSNRLAYMLYKGDIPEDLEVLHTCDVMHCVNPKHLYLGTSQRNTLDAFERNRRSGVRGEAHRWTKLTKDQVIEIKLRLAKGATCKALSAVFAVSKSTIQEIKSGRNWKHV